MGSGRSARCGSGPPGNGFAEARRRAAEVVEAVERGRDPWPMSVYIKLPVLAMRPTPTWSRTTLQTSPSVGSSKHVRDVRYALYDKALPQLGHMRPRTSGRYMSRASWMRSTIGRPGDGAASAHLSACRVHNQLGTTSNSREVRPRDQYPADRVGRDGRYREQPVDERHLTDTEIINFWRSLDQSEIAERPSWYSSCCYSRGSAKRGALQRGRRELKLEGDRPEVAPAGVVRERGKPPKRRTKERPPAAGAAAISGREALPARRWNLLRMALRLRSDKTRDATLGAIHLGQATSA